MEEKDLTNAVIDKTDALIARHREIRPAVFPTPPEAITPPQPLPVLNKKVSPEEAARLLSEQDGNQLESSLIEPQIEPKLSITRAETTFSPVARQNEGLTSSTSVNTETIAFPVSAAISKSEKALSETAVQGVQPLNATLKEEVVDVRSADSANLTSCAINIEAVINAIAPELANLVTELTKEVSSSVIRQMAPKVREIVEKRSRELVSEAISKANAEK